MLKYLVVFALLIGAANCDEGEQPAGPDATGETAPAPPPPSGPNRINQLKSLGTGLFDFSLLSAKHLTNLGREATPLVDKAGRAIGNEAVGLAKSFQSSEFAQGTVSAVDGHPTVQRIKPYAASLGQGLQKLGPYAGQGIQKLTPLVREGIKKANPVVDQMNKGRLWIMAGHRDRMTKLKNEYYPPPPPPPAPEGSAGPN